MNGTLHLRDGRSVLVFERRLRHSPDRVWRAVTDPDQLRHWFPSEMRLDLTLGGRIRFVFLEDQAPPGDGVITDLDPPRLFAYTWDEDHLRWELFPDGTGTRLVLAHTFADRAGAASFASGWETCVDALELLLDDRPPKPPEKYRERHEAYVDAFNLGHGAASRTGDGWLVRFERQFPFPVNEVWTALGGPGGAIGEPAPAGATTSDVPAGDVTAVEPATLLEYLSDGGWVRFELGSGPGGGRITLTQTLPADRRAAVAAALAGWHAHLEALADRLGGTRRHPDPAQRIGELRKHYAEVVSATTR
jgi:uncharacterized protein YndB with AHSA1/START domain